METSTLHSFTTLRYASHTKIGGSFCSTAGEKSNCSIVGYKLVYGRPFESRINIIGLIFVNKYSFFVVVCLIVFVEHTHTHTRQPITTLPCNVSNVLFALMYLNI